MLLHLGRVPVLVVSTADAAREIMKTQDLIFSNRPKLRIPDKILYSCKDVSFAPYGEYWRHVRSICVLQLLSNKRVQSFRHVRETETSLMIQKIKLQESSSVVNLSDVFSTLTNDIVCKAAFGRKYNNSDGQQFKVLLAEFVELLGRFSVGDYVPWLGWIDGINGLSTRVDKVAKEFDQFLEGVILEKKLDGMVHKDHKGSDFVDILIQIQRESEDTSHPIENDVIKALILDMFAAGTDTTSSVLVWTMTELLRHPNTLKKLQNEVTTAGKEEITEDDLDKMHYLKAVIKESLRLHTPLPLLVPRESTEDTKVMGYEIAARTQVIINAWAISRDPLLWEDPQEFKPERFLETSIDFKGVHFELIPFGAGRRGCPGLTFAVAVNELALAKLVHKFNIGLPNGETEKDLDISEVNGITVHKKHPLLVVINPR
ncbi:hypothetical protein RD792_004807 [Penstemon davidsonii]|uniref:Uncharacterized protein n=1 Tax=Penstemon davidsonii TaxID=160366 RepID=A0ABR0DIG2_9LAMI|nr:hypothetical protein RD792_004807 [Penstemon davidsonii]